MRPTSDFSLELTAQELMDLPDRQGLIEIEDICAAGEIQPQAAPANMDLPAIAAGDSFEIELTAEEMDALLEGKL